MPDTQDTIAAIATAPGKSGIGIIRLSGPKSLEIATQITTISITPRQAHFTSIYDRNQQVIDTAIVIYFNSPDSYTGEDVVELQGHGSMVILNMLLKEILSLGARPAAPGEFTQRAYLNGKLDLVQAEAVADLISSNSEKSARRAIQSLNGEFSARINRLVDGVTSVRAYVEGALDFPEEEVDFLADSSVLENIREILEKLDQLLKSATAGKKLRQGVSVVIIGRPNVGKSSLLNLLSGSEKAIVTDLAGTTRDIVEETIYLSGMAITLVDTAGIRNPDNIIEEEGIRRSRAQIKEADVVLLVTDQTEISQQELQMAEENNRKKLLIIHNKIDVYNHKAESISVGGRQHFYVSVKHNKGVDDLIRELGEAATNNNDIEDLVLARERHIQLLIKARLALSAGLEEFTKYNQGELLAESLKKTQKHLGEITGEVHSDDLLGEIFSRFCIGK